MPPTADDPTLTASHAEPAPARGVCVGRYQLGALLGQGGMGMVYRAQDPELDRPLAIKLMVADDDGGRARVLREAQAMARLHHPNVVPVFDVGSHGREVFLVMPLLSGGTLGAWLRASARPWRAVVTRFLAAARGLAAAHAAGLVHRDFKPENVLLGGGDEVQVADFGLVRVEREADEPAVGGGVGSDESTAGAIRGTPAYMAPEQLDGADVDARADQFAFCVALHEGVYGRRPFEATEVRPLDLVALRDEMRAGRVREANERRAPRWLRAAIVRGLRDDPAARWPSMDVLIAAIERRLHRPRRAAFLAIGALAIAVAATAIVVGRSPRPTPAQPPAPPPPTWSERQLTTRGDVREAALSPDGTQVAVLGRGVVAVVPADGGTERVLARDLAADLYFLSWSPDGRLLSFATLNPDVRYYAHRTIDVATGAISAAEIRGGPHGVLTSDGELVSQSGRDTLAFTHLATHPPMRSCPLPGVMAIVDVDVAGTAIYATVDRFDGKRALLVTDRTCAPIRTALPTTAATGFLPRADGRIAAWLSDGGQLRIVEHDASGAPTGEAPLELPVGVSGVVGLRPDGGVVTTHASAPWRLVDAARPDDLVGHGSSLPLIVVAPDRRRVAVLEEREETISLRLGEIERLDALGPPIATAIGGVAWSPDGARLATCSRDDGGTRLAIRDLTGAVLADLGPVDAAPACQVVWLDDQRIAYQRGDNRTYVWIALTDRSTGALINPKGATYSLAVAPDGTAAFGWAMPMGGDVRILPRTGEPYAIHADGVPDRLAWSSDSQTLWIMRERHLERWDRRTGKVTRVDVALDRDARIYDVFPLADRVLIETATLMTDVFVYAPDR